MTGALGRAGGAAKGAKAELTGFAAVQKTLSAYARDAMNWGKGLGETLVSAFQGAETALRGFVEGGKLDFRSLIRSMIADLAMLAIRRTILGPLATALVGVFGGGGFDILSFDEGVRDVSFSLAIEIAQETNIGSIYAEQIEGVVGTIGNDQLSGDTQGNVLKGAGGNDTLRGGAGSDTIYGENGEDIFIALVGDGDDEYFGGSGRDWLDFSSSSYGVKVNLNHSTQTIGSYGTDKIAGIENIGGGSGNDTLSGNREDNILDGGKGDDQLDGGLGADTLIGGLGNDTFIGAAGSDTLEGGSGADLFVFKAGDGADLIADFSIEDGDLIQISGADLLEVAEIDGYFSIIYSETSWFGFKGISDISDIYVLWSSIELI